MNKGLKWAGWIVTGLVALLFIQAGVMKVIAEPTTAQGFRDMGFPVWFMIVIGLAEVVGGIFLFVPKYSRYAAALLGAIMVGAIVTTLMSGQAAMVAFPAVTLAVLVVIGILRKPQARLQGSSHLRGRVQ